MPGCFRLIIVCVSATALIFVLAPLPNALSSRRGSDEFSSYENGAGLVDMGRFLTSITVVTGFSFPVVLAHSGIIDPKASAMSILGGGYALDFFSTLVDNNCNDFTDSFTLLSSRILPSSPKQFQNMINPLLFDALYLDWAP